MPTKTISQLVSSGQTLDGSELYEAEQVSGSFPTSIKVRGKHIQQVPVEFMRLKLNQAAQAHQEGLMEWNNMDHTMNLHTDVTDVVFQVGQETVARVMNQTGETILNGTPVAYGGVSPINGHLPLIIKAQSNNAARISSVSVATHDIANNSRGYVTKRGIVRGLDTTAWSEGDILYVSPVSAGAFTTTRPVSPNRVVAVGGVLGSHATSGSIYVDPVTYTDNMQIIVYNLPLSGVTGTEVPLAGTFVTVGASATANVTTDWGPQGHHVFIRVNELTNGGDITIEGTSINETTGVSTASDTETITVYPSASRPAVSKSEHYQTTKKWYAITNITLGGGIAGINFNYGYVGYPDMGNRNFRLLGYRLEAFSDGPSPDMRLRIWKMDGSHGKKKMDVHLIEDIGVDSDNAGNQIVDHVRTGADDRSYNSPLTTIWGNGELFVLKQLDFDAYWKANPYEEEVTPINEIKARDEDSGYVIRIEGEGGGLTNVQYIHLIIYYELMGAYE